MDPTFWSLWAKLDTDDEVKSGCTFDSWQTPVAVSLHSLQLLIYACTDLTLS